MLHQLKSISEKKKKRLGRGHGSGRGMKSGRGTTRHQNAREKIPLHFEGGQGRLVKKFPLLRGKARNKSYASYYEIRLEQLNKFNDGDTITRDSLAQTGIISAKNQLPVKVILKGELTKKVTVAVPVTKGVRAAVEKIGGSVTTV